MADLSGNTPGELVAVTDAHRESAESWADLLRDCKRRGMTTPVLAIGDGALGFWKASARCSPRPGATLLVSYAGQCSCRAAEIGAPGRAGGDARDLQRRGHRQAQLAVKVFEADFAAKYPKAVAKITNDLDTPLEFYNYPAEHWIHL